MRKRKAPFIFAHRYHESWLVLKRSVEPSWSRGKKKLLMDLLPDCVKDIVLDLRACRRRANNNCIYIAPFTNGYKASFILYSLPCPVQYPQTESSLNKIFLPLKALNNVSLSPLKCHSPKWLLQEQPMNYYSSSSHYLPLLLFHKASASASASSFFTDYFPKHFHC